MGDFPLHCGIAPDVGVHEWPRGWRLYSSAHVRPMDMLKVLETILRLAPVVPLPADPNELTT